MNSLFLLTQSANSFLRPIARVLGWIMNGIYNFMDSFLNIQNVALTIVIFTIIIYIIMLPLTYQQQKFSKLSQIMQPEIQAVQKKYRGKKDSISMQRQNEETQEIYRKYGVRPSGSCVFMVIQFLILIPLYRVIYSVPGYVTRVRETFDGLVTSIMNTPDYQNTMTAFLDTISENNSVMRQVSLNFTETSTDAYNSIIDVLYRCTSDNWHLLANTFSSLSDLVQSTQTAVEHFTSFLGASIVYAPMVLIRTSASSGHYGLIFIGILIPVISAATQFLSVRLMPQANTGQGDQMGNQMRMMNYFMPIYSFFIVFFLPIGIGIYWIAGAVIRIVQQFFINRHFDRIDMNALIEKNAQKTAEKEKKKVERKGVSGEQIRSAAGINTRQIPRSMSERAASVQMMDDNANSKASSKGGSSGKSSSGTGSSGKSSSGTGSSGKSSWTKKKKEPTPTKPAPEAAAEAETAAETEAETTVETTAKTKKSASQYKEGSMAALANKVSEYNEKNSKSK